MTADAEGGPWKGIQKLLVVPPELLEPPLEEELLEVPPEDELLEDVPPLEELLLAVPPDDELLEDELLEAPLLEELELLEEEEEPLDDDEPPDDELLDEDPPDDEDEEEEEEDDEPAASLDESWWQAATAADSTSTLRTGHAGARRVALDPICEFMVKSVSLVASARRGRITSMGKGVVASRFVSFF